MASVQKVEYGSREGSVFTAQDKEITEGSAPLVYCLFCRRLYSASPLKEAYENAVTFNRYNQLECPWCNRRESVIAVPEHKKEAVNGSAFAPKIEYVKKPRPSRWGFFLFKR
jgi:hypothetical protein